MNIFWLVTLPIAYHIIYGTAGNEIGNLLKTVTLEANENESCYGRGMERISSKNPKFDFDFIPRKKRCAFQRKIPEYLNTFAVPTKDEISKITIDKASNPSSSKKGSDEMTRNHCVQCNVSFRYDNHYAKHCKEVHGIKRPFPCGICKREFITKHYLTDHVNEMHGLKNNPFSHWKKNEPMACHVCQEYVAGWTKFEQHALSKHKGMKMMRCSYCPEEYFRRRQMLHHEKKEHGKLEVKCDICKNIFERSDLLKEHMKFCEQRQIRKKMGDNKLDTVVRSKMLVCEECGDEYKTFTLLKDHHRLKHPSVKLHACVHCDAAYSYNKSLEKHVDMVHPDKTGEIKTGKKFKRGAIYACEYCEENFAGILEYEKHGKRHPGMPMFRCEICEKGYSTRKSLRYHANEVHGDAKKRCSYCSKCYFQIWTHEMQCKKKIERREGKRMAGYPKHYCDICSQDFYMKAPSFKAHVNRHKYLDCCSICGQCFRRGEGGLMKHMERKHPLWENIEALLRTADEVRTFAKREMTTHVQYTKSGTKGLHERKDFYGHEVKAEASDIYLKLKKGNSKCFK